MKIKLTTILILLIILTACAEPLPQERLDYVGNWVSDEMGLLILKDGSVAYKRIKGGTTVSVNGPIKEFVSDDFVVGFAWFTTTFEVSEPPHLVDGNWQMVVDGVRLTKASKN